MTTSPSSPRRVALAIALPVALFAATGTASAREVPAQVAEPDAVAAAEPEDAATAVRLELAGTYETGVFDASAAEITAYDPATERLFVVNADSGAVDVLDVSDPTDPALVETISAAGTAAADGSTVPEGAVVNSVAVSQGRLAVAVEAPDKVDLGWVLFFDTDGEALAGVRAGALPDMVTFTPAGDQAVVANEGEPAEDFSTDPEGSIAVIDVTDLATLGQDDVRTARFTAYEGAALPEGVRVFGPDVPVPTGQEDAGRVARNLEPEYVAVAPDGSRAWVSVQEANAIAEIDLVDARISDLWAIPGKDHSVDGQGLDPSNRDDAIAIDTWPVTGLAMPDGIDTYDVGGQTHIVTANEGDAREWGDYEEPLRLGDDAYELCADAFGGPEGVAALKEEAALGRLNVTTATGRTDAGCYDEIVAFGGRSFSILDPEGAVVFDSGDMIEQQIARLVDQGDLPLEAFNATNDETPSFDNRSDDKGPEPESVEIGEVDGRTFAFVALERIGGVMVFDITDPAGVQFTTYVNNRAWDVVVDGEAAEGMGDLGAEGVEFIPGASSPTGRPLLAVANEVSGSTTLFDIDVVVPGRVAGADRYGTAAEVAASFPTGGDTAYVASGEVFPDALVGAALAGAGSDPVLLARPGSVPAVTAQALRDLDPGKIVLLGGTRALSTRVEAQLAAIAPVERLAGDDRYGTAAAVADRFADPARVYVASGADFPDALSAAAIAGGQGAPVLLTSPTDLPGATAQALADLDPVSIVLLGGSQSVSDDVAEELRSYAPVARVAGADRFETSALLAERASDTSAVYLANGRAFPDALAGAALAGAQGSAVVLTEPEELPGSVDAALAAADPRTLVILGGELAVSQAVARAATVYVE